MSGFNRKRTQGLRRTGALAALAIALGAGIPALAQADVIATFDWVSYTTTTGQTPATTPSGAFSVDLSAFNLTGSGNSAYYSSGSAVTGTITALSYTFGDGLTVGLSDLTSTTLSSRVWSTSATVTPAFVTTAAQYLTTGLALPGTADGGTFNLASAAGTAGATFANGVTLAGNSITPSFPPFSASDAGYWKFDGVTPVPLPAALPLLLGGLGFLGRMVRSRAN